MAELPKQDLLVKLLNMTTSDAESEVLMAIRRANVLLREAGWSWDMLIHEKIKIVENPFKNLGDPIATRQRDGGAKPAPPPPQQTWRPPPPQPPPPPQHYFPYQSQALAVSGVHNTFGGHCYHCGWYQNPNEGFWFSPHKFNKNAPLGGAVICKSCDTFLDGKTNIRDIATNPRGKPKMGPAAAQPIPQSSRQRTRRGGSTPVYKPGVGEL